MKKIFDHSNNEFERVVSGRLKDAIIAHGPITLENHSSATKRVANGIRGWLIVSAKTIQQEAFDEAVSKFKKEFDEIK